MSLTQESIEKDRSPGSSPKSPHRILRTIRNSPSILRKKIKNSGKDHLESPEKERGRFSPKLKLKERKSCPPECKVFHVLYQGKIRVATLQVHEALAAVKKLTDMSGNSLSVEDNKESDDQDASVPPKSPRLSPKVPRSPKLSPMLRRKTLKSPKKNNLKVTPKYLSIDDPKSSEVEILPISTIAYCATDIRHPKAVAFINKEGNGGLICHVLLCDTKEKASDIVSCIGEMFESAWEEWKELHPDPPSGRISPSHLGRSSSFHSRTYNSLMVPESAIQRTRPNSFNVPARERLLPSHRGLHSCHPRGLAFSSTLFTPLPQSPSTSSSAIPSIITSAEKDIDYMDMEWT